MAGVEVLLKNQSSCTKGEPKSTMVRRLFDTTQAFDILNYSGERDLDPNQVECFLTEPNESANGTCIASCDTLSCQICRISFEGTTSRHRLLEHINLIHRFEICYKGQTCELCCAVFYTWKAFEVHKSTCKEKSKSTYPIASSIGELQTQRDDGNSKDVENVECDVTLDLNNDNNDAKQSKVLCKDGQGVFADKVPFKPEKSLDGFEDAMGIAEDSAVKKSVLNNAFKCYICSSVFSGTIDFRSHLLDSHKNEVEDFDAVSYRCKKCCTTFPNLFLLRGHFFKKHVASIIYRCIICHISLRTKKSLRIHYKSFHSHKSKEPHTCDECGKQLSNLQAIKAHIRLKHGPNIYKQGLQCRLCERKFDSKESRKIHYEEEHLGESPFMCTDCGKGFSSKSGLYGHRQLHKTDQPSTCPHCEKVFNRRDSYHEHMLIHVGPKHRCPHCPKEFVQRSNLVRHIRIHTGQKPYTCTFCDKRFSDKGACNSHIRVHTKEEQCICPYCGQTFTKKQKLKYHIRKHTGEGLMSCEVCSKSFTNSFALKEHRAIHDRQTQTICVDCGKAFNSEKYLLRHIALVHQEPQDSNMDLDCPICEKTFCHETRLKSHLATHLGKKHLQCVLCDKQYSSMKSIRNHLQHSHGLKPNQPEFKKYVHSEYQNVKKSSASMAFEDNLRSPGIQNKDMDVKDSFQRNTDVHDFRVRDNKDNFDNKATAFHNEQSILSGSDNKKIVLADNGGNGTVINTKIWCKNQKPADIQETDNGDTPWEAKISTNTNIPLMSNFLNSVVIKEELSYEIDIEDELLSTTNEDILNGVQDPKIHRETALDLPTTNEMDEVKMCLKSIQIYESKFDNKIKKRNNEGTMASISLDDLLPLPQLLCPRQLQSNSSAIIKDGCKANDERNCFGSKNNSMSEFVPELQGCKTEIEPNLNLTFSNDTNRRRKQLRKPKKYVSPINTLNTVDNEWTNIIPKRARVEAIARLLKKSTDLEQIPIEATK